MGSFSENRHAPTVVHDAMPAKVQKKVKIASWSARLAVAIVFVGNIQCALYFLLFPENYAPSFELSGVAGIAAIQGLAVAFLMWNATYPLVFINPSRHRTLFAIVLVQQAIGLLGESLILSGVGPDHALLRESITRFIVFDAAGLVIMGATFAALILCLKRSSR